jgi:hypothetical protein
MRRELSTLLLLSIIALVSIVRISSTIPDEPQGRDAGRYVAWGENLAREGVYGVGTEKHMRSAPLLSAAIAVGLRIDPRHADFRESGVLSDHRAVRQVNLFFIALLQAASIATVFLIYGQGRRAIVGSILTLVLLHVFLFENPEFTHPSLQELPTAAVLGWANVMALATLRSGRLRWAFGLGITGGLLALSRGVFLHIFPVFAILLLLLASDWEQRRRVRTFATVLLGFSLTAGPWVARNVIEFGEFSVSDLGGAVLLIRDVKNDMTSYQHRGAWVHYSPEPLRPIMARALRVDMDDFLGEGLLRPLVRYLPDPLTGEDLEKIERRSFYRQAGTLREEFYERAIALGASDPQARVQVDRDSIELVVTNVREDPLRFIRTAPVFLYRSAWPMDQSQLWEPTGMTLPRIMQGVVNPAGMLGLLGLGAIGLFRRRPAWFALGGLGTGMVLYHALLTHALPRYSRPVAGVMLLLVAVALVSVSERVPERTRIPT